MTSRLTKHTYERLVEENLQWLREQPRTLEREHVIEIVRASTEHEYSDLFMENLALKNQIAELEFRIKGLEK